MDNDTTKPKGRFLEYLIKHKIIHEEAREWNIDGYDNIVDYWARNKQSRGTSFTRNGTYVGPFKISDNYRELKND